MRHPILYKRDFVGIKFAPDEIIVKFKQGAAAALEEKTSAGTAAEQLELPGSLDKLNRKSGLRNIKPLFKNFKADRKRLKALLTKDKSLLTKHEKRILQRLRRAPQKAAIPALDRIYKLHFSLAPDESIQKVMAEYNDDPSVEYADLNYRVSIRKEPDDPCYPLQWSLDNIGQDYPVSGKYGFPPGTPDSDIDAPQAWDFHTGNSEIVIAVVDTGVDVSHRDLQGNIWINSGEIPGNHVDDDGNGYIDDIYGYDFLNDDSDPNDDHGHGTHCSGIIAAGGNNGLDITGVCWNARIMALKFLDEKGEGLSSDAVTALYYAAKNGADVISNSWSSPFSSDAMEEVIEYVHSLGVIMVASAGNKNHALPHYPAFYGHTIAVAATDSDDKRAPFSNYGKWVDIAAPGVDVLSLRAGLTSMGTIYDDYTTVASGTSMACPHVAAVIALIISNHPNASTHVIIERLFTTTDDISIKNPGFDGMLGAGRVNAYKAVRDGFEGIVTFDSDFYSCDDIVSIEVFDFDLIGQGIQPITLTTDAGDLETANVVEDTNKPWLFAGTIHTSSDAVIAEDGVLQLSHGQIITATYFDSDDGSGNPAVATATATADCVSPEIFNVQIDVPGPEPEVTFQTNEPTTARVLAGFTCGGPYIIEATSSILSTSHSIKLKGVSPTTDYFYIVEAADAVGNKTMDDNAGACYAFTTDVGPRDIYVPAQYPTIQEAIKRSWDGGTVWVADGFYQGPGNRDIDFLGRAIIVRSENGPFSCIIDCQGSKVDPHRGFYFHEGEGATSVLDGFMIINGYATDEGGGIYCTASSPTLINCMFYGNSAQYWGGAISNRGSSSTLTNCTFGENTARWGGAVACCYCYEGPTLADCTFSNNSARHGGALYNDHSRSPVTNCDFSNNSATYGAGVYNFAGVYDLSFIGPKLHNCTFSENSSSSLGGGMFNFESSPTVTNCEFTDNSALHYAGAVYSSDGSNPILENCTFSSNSAEDGGAIYCRERSRAVFANCSITGNSAQLNGGGVYGGLGQVRNCNIADNDASIGGGLYGFNGQVTNCIINGNIAISRGGAFSSCNGPIINCTIADNSGGGLDSCFGTIINCIIWNGDTGGSPGESVLSGSSVPLYSCVQSGSGGIGCIRSDPCFIDAQNGDYHLLPNSPCKDSGNYYYCMNLPCTDLDGATRMGGVQIDMGCYEAGGTPDIDGDWLAAPQEGLYGTHPNLPDTDGDGLADGQEILGGTNPLAADPLRTWQVPTDSITIQQALFFSRPSEVIILAEGTYHENIYFGGRNITLTGGDPNEPNVVAATVISGDTDYAPETMSGRVVNLMGTEDTACHISGLTITGGCTNAGGGGIYGAGARAGISKCIISSNYALDGGGGLYECDGPVTNCTVTANLAADGGGLYHCNGPITDCTIIENLADFRGGAMFNCGGEYICYGPNDCVFSIENCLIADNSAPFGGGIYNSITSLTLTKCIFRDNTAEDYGGGMYNYQSGPEMTNCIFSGNSANCGGGIYNYERTKPTLINCTFAQNSASNGNALVCDSNDQQYPSYLQLTNCILWDGGDEVWNNDSSTIIITYSDVQGGWPDVGNIDADPLFTDANSGDYRLLAGSPCIDSAIEAGVYEDIDGNARPFDFPGADSNDESFGFDMGAYEAVATTQCELIVLPRIIVRGGGGEKITAIMRLPETIVKDDIDAYEPLVMYPGAIKAIRQNLIPPSMEAKSNTRIHAVFDTAELFTTSVDNVDIQLTVTGRFNTGKYFYGTDTIRIISP
ncbi:MAG: S8 family serine peptidase [Phycisphaerae bacterium]|nr:S8 family serine peptidase [Phycisphaerae bacterium]